MSDKEVSDVEEMVNSSDLTFVKLIVNYPELFDRSQTPNARKAKREALDNIQKNYIVLFGKEITLEQVAKKISNMKTRIKRKLGYQYTGERKGKLTEDEQLLYDILKDEAIVSFHQIPNSLAIEIENSDQRDEESVPVILESDLSSTSISPRKRRKQNEHTVFDFETPETKDLSNLDLQQMVYLRQLEVLNMKKKRLLGGQLGNSNYGKTTKINTSRSETVSRMKNYKINEDKLCHIGFSQEMVTASDEDNENSNQDNQENAGKRNCQLTEKGLDSSIINIKDKLKADEAVSSTVIKYILEKIDQKQTPVQVHPVDAFLVGIAATLKTFTPYHLNLAKTRIFAAVQELEMEQTVEHQGHFNVANTSAATVAEPQPQF